jgi:hypothetical protein
MNLCARQDLILQARRPGAGARTVGETAGGTMSRHRHDGVVHLQLHTHDLTEVRVSLWQLLGRRSRGKVGTAGSNYLALSVSDRMGGGIVECGQRPPSWLPMSVSATCGGRLSMHASSGLRCSSLQEKARWAGAASSLRRRPAILPCGSRRPSGIDDERPGERG